MQPIRVARNMYRGINAHLQSALQAQPGWMGFHALHIAHLAESLAAKLVPLGYRVHIENGRQIREGHSESYTAPRADIAIFPPTAGRSIITQAQLTASIQVADVLTVPNFDLFDLENADERLYKAIAIYHGERDTPIAWLELLAPFNKGSRVYLRKRWRILRRGIVFIELDYLHQSNPTLPTLIPYQQGGSPYRILVVDPRPTFEDGNTRLARCWVDQALPTVPIPLQGDDLIPIDFNAPYQRTFEGLWYGLNTDYPVDYAQFPVGWEHYTPADQARIAARMLAVIEVVGRGESLDGPPPTETLTLEEALTRLAAHGVAVPEST